MTDRTIINALEQMRDFDFVSFEHDVLVSLGALAQDMQSGQSITTVAGLAATQTVTPSLTINIAAGRIYQIAQADTTVVGSIPIDNTQIVQQGQNPGQTVTLVAPSAGQSQWNLIQAQFSQVDAVRAGDPNGGVVPFYNASNPTQPNSSSINTVRQGKCVIAVVTGTAATTGSEVPPTASVGWVPLYLIDVTGGQTQITTSQVLKAAPSVGTGVSASYARAPFLAGLLAQHHLGVPGHAPKINLASEVQGVLPYANMSPTQQLLSGDLTMFVGGTGASDTNNGLSAGTPFATIQAALNSATHNYNFNGFALKLTVANGTYTPAAGAPAVIFIPGNPVGCVGIVLTGNVLSPGSVTITGTNALGLWCVNGSSITISGVTFTASGNGTSSPAQGYGILSQTAGTVSLANCAFGACSTGQIFSSQGGNVGVTGPASFTGSTPFSLGVGVGSLLSISGTTITVTGLNVSSAFAVAFGPAQISAIGNTFSGSATGPRYTATQNGVINTNGAGSTYLPGSTSGSTSTGGQYI